MEREAKWHDIVFRTCYGLEPGDKAINNPPIPRMFVEGTDEDKEAFIGALIPQDGTISGKMISWTHSNVLHTGEKTEAYNFESKVGTREVQFIKEYGIEGQHAYALRLGTLEELAKSESDETAKTARALMTIIDNNRNNFIEDERLMVESLSVSVRVLPTTTRYHKRSGRVSVAWRARPESLLESFKLGIIAPPNDVKKRGKLAEILRSDSKRTEDAVRELKSNGMRIERWWEE